jgi:FixJ family two-component response regulator
LGQKDITIFIVDDDRSVRRALKRLVKIAGFSARTFASALEFWDSGRFRSRGVLVLDVRMPGMSGLELQKQLIDSDSDIPIIFITAHEDIQASRKALEAGAVAFLQKPFEDQALINAINSALC